MEKNYKRTEIYENKRKDTKYMFIWLCDKVEKNNYRREKILDVGCASGDFLDYFSTRFPGKNCIGLEFDKKLVEIGNQRSQEKYEIIEGDANKMTQIKTMSQDLVFMTGTHSIFEDFKFSFSEVIRSLKPGGRALITGFFNDYELDAKIYWRYPENEQGNWHPGYNLFSKKSVSNFLNTYKNIDNYNFEKFNLPFKLARQEDPVRSWSEEDKDGNLFLRNGIMELNFQLLTIRKK
tara:strand:- start:580 stop:1284 length:705 start_codon:yes stop_codon:yes gene_type:complete